MGPEVINRGDTTVLLDVSVPARIAASTTSFSIFLAMATITVVVTTTAISDVVAVVIVIVIVISPVSIIVVVVTAIPMGPEVINRGDTTVLLDVSVPARIAASRHSLIQ